jgi:hypothetical protein
MIEGTRKGVKRAVRSAVRELLVLPEAGYLGAPEPPCHGSQVES